MPIERVNIQTPDFHVRATNIRGGQLNNVLNALRSGAAYASHTAARLSAGERTGPGAIRSPAERFPEVAASGGGGQAGATPETRGFAPGGDDQMRSLDTNGVMRMIVELLERLLQAITQLVGQGSGAGSCGAGDDEGQGTSCPTGSPGGASTGGPSTCGGGGGGGMTSGPGHAGGPTGGGHCPTPPRNPTSSIDNGMHSRRARARPKRPSIARRILGEVGRGAAAAAPFVPGGAAVQTGVALASRPGGNRAGGGGGGGASLDDRIFAFMSNRVRGLEGELDAAMQQADGAGGESSTLATQKVQQLVQKRSEAIEALTNTLKTLHDSTQAVNRNIKT